MDSSDALSRSRCRERRLNKRSFFWSHKIPLWMWLLMQHWQHIVNNWWFVHSSWSDLSNRPSFTVHRNTSHMQIITCRAMELTSVATALKHRQYNSKPFRLLASYLISTVNLFKASGCKVKPRQAGDVTVYNADRQCSLNFLAMMSFRLNRHDENSI